MPEASATAATSTFDKGAGQGGQVRFSHESADRQRNQAFGPGAKRDPFVRLGSRLRHARFKLHQVTTLRLLAHLRKIRECKPPVKARFRGSSRQTKKSRLRPARSKKGRPLAPSMHFRRFDQRGARFEHAQRPITDRGRRADGSLSSSETRSKRWSGAIPIRKAIPAGSVFCQAHR